MPISSLGETIYSMTQVTRTVSQQPWKLSVHNMGLPYGQTPGQHVQTISFVELKTVEIWARILSWYQCYCRYYYYYYCWCLTSLALFLGIGHNGRYRASYSPASCDFPSKSL